MSVLAFWQATPTSLDQMPSVHTPFLEYLEVLFVLAGVLLVAYAALRIGLPRFFGMRLPNNGPIQTVARYPLEPRKTLYLVNVGSQMFLVGTSENQVHYLTPITPENAAEILAAETREKARGKDFRQVLSWFQKAGKADC
jgi:flagellar biogenesis protein FliO